MKVAFITHCTNLGGANRSLLNLIDGLKSYKIDSYVIAPAEGDITDELQFRKVQFAILPVTYWVSDLNIKGSILKQSFQIIRKSYSPTKSLFSSVSKVSAFANQLKDWNIDVVYTNSSVTPIGALVAQQIHRPHIWHLREFLDLDYGLYFHWGKFISNYVIGKADAKIAVSKAVRSHFTNGISPNNSIQVIYNGIASIAEFDRFYELVHSTPAIDKPYTFAIVGGISPNKGQHIAIKALAALADDFPKIRLLIVGGGDTTYLKELSRELNILDKVEFWGHTYEPYKAYLASDAVLMCSRNEAMGRVTAEGMSACRPVIGYDNAGTSELIQHEYTGLLYQDGHKDLAACMKLFVENPDWAKTLGENAWRVAREKYSIETYAQKVYEVLISVVRIPNTPFKNNAHLS